METELATAASSQLPIASAARAPLFVNVPLSRLLRLPAALLTELANHFLTDTDVQKLAQTCSAMPQLLRPYRIKEFVPLQRAIRTPPLLSSQLAALPASLRFLVSLNGASLAAMEGRLARLRFGVLSSVAIGLDDSDGEQLDEKLQQLPRSVRTVQVHDSSARDSAESEPEGSFLRHVVLRLPAHIRSLIFDDEAEYINGEEIMADDLRLLPPVEDWSLPAGLTELDLPCWMQLDEEGHGASMQLPPQLVELRLGDELNHSLAKLKLPASLRVLHFGVGWNQPASDWPLLPDGLEELELPSGFNHPLSSLRLPHSLRKLHFPSYLCLEQEDEEGWVSHLFDNPSADMFPPGLESLHLPQPLNDHSEQEMRKKAKAESKSIEPIWTGSAPLNLSLLPSSLRVLHLHRAQAVVCNPPSSSLDWLRLDHLRVFRWWQEQQYDRTEACRQKLRRQMRLLKTAKRATRAAQDPLPVGAGAGSGAAAAVPAAAASVAPTEAANAAAQLAAAATPAAPHSPSFTMGTNKRG
jgi:hypothetical protein